MENTAFGTIFAGYAGTVVCMNNGGRLSFSGRAARF